MGYKQNEKKSDSEEAAPHFLASSFTPSLLTLLVQEYGLGMVSVPSALTLQGPFSIRRARMEEHPLKLF